MARPNAATTEARIEHIAQLMRTCRFTRGVDIKRLAREWGISLDRTKRLSAEASRRVHAELDVAGREQASVLSRTVLEHAAVSAMADATRASKSGNFHGAASARRSATEAVARLMDLTGLNTSRKPASWETLAPEEQLRRIDDARAKLAILEAQVRARIAAPALPEGNA